MLMSLAFIASVTLGTAEAELPFLASQPNMLPQVAGQVGRGRFEQRWLYVSFNLQVNENVLKVQNLLQRAAAVGYNGAILADFKLSILDIVPDFYFKNLKAVLDTGKLLGMEIIPAVMPIGYSSGLLAHDPNLAEGLPAKDVPFVVAGGRAVPDPASQPKAVNLDFEQSTGDKMTGWGFQDDIGKTTFADRTTVHNGSQSLRMESIGANGTSSGNCRIQQVVDVRPFTPYRVRVWIKSEDFSGAGNTRIAVLGEDGKPVDFSELEVQRTQDWKQHSIQFNSLNHNKVRIYFGVWGGGTGKLWWDGGSIEQAGLLNLLRRPGCPITVARSDGSKLVEGKDFEPLEDPMMGKVPWPGGYDRKHDSPPITLKAASGLKDGDKLNVSFYHAAIVLGDQVTICLNEPKAQKVMQDHLKQVVDATHAASYLLSHDEIRVANWCQACQSTGKTPGEQLADNVRKSVAWVRALEPKAKLYLWSDMFDPNHNAKSDYYLVNGSYEGSWLGVPKDVVIVNWHYGARLKSLPFFSARGHKQVLAGFYDGPVDAIKTWLKDSSGVPGITGVMYTTWQSDYSKLEEFAKAAWGG